MKKLISLLTACVLVASVLFVAGCEKGTGLNEDYNTPSMSFKGLNMECVSDGDKLTMVRNNMVYTDFEKFVTDDLNSKGNSITSIEIGESSAEVFHENQTVAVMSAKIESDGGDIKSGDYYIAAYFTYDMTNEANVKMYLINYCFVPDYKVYPSLFEESYEKIKDKV